MYNMVCQNYIYYKQNEIGMSLNEIYMSENKNKTFGRKYDLLCIFVSRTKNISLTFYGI